MLRLDRGRYLTPTAARREVPGARIIETTYTPGQCLPRHAHEFVYMVVMVDGSLRETSMGREHDLARGWVIFNSAGESHHNEVLAPGTRCLNVELRPSLLERINGDGAVQREVVVYTHVGRAIDAVGRLYSAVCDPLGELEAEEAITDLIGAACGTRRGGEPEHQYRWLSRIIEHLHATFRGGFRLDDLARVAGVHRVHLCRSFRAGTGCTIGEYVRRLRADAAHRRLCAGDAPLASVASECGYSDQSHMTREVGRWYGRAPSRVRERTWWGAPRSRGWR